MSKHSNIIYKVNIVSELEPQTYSVVTNTGESNILYLKYTPAYRMLPKLNILLMGFVLLAILGDFS